MDKLPLKLIPFIGLKGFYLSSTTLDAIVLKNNFGILAAKLSNPNLITYQKNKKITYFHIKILLITILMKLVFNLPWIYNPQLTLLLKLEW